MKFKIGFSAEKEDNKVVILENNQSDCINATLEKNEDIRKSVVEVFFPDKGTSYPYYNDMFNLKCGDIVFVEGKLEGFRGTVVDVTYTFKIRPSNYKRVIGLANTKVTGKFITAGSHLITTDSNALKYEQIITWFKAPQNNDDFIYSIGDETFNLDDLKEMHISPDIAERGRQYYLDNNVVYIELNHGKGRAIVKGSEYYELDFNYHNKEISGLLCDCYCVGICKHQFAVMLQLKETLDFVFENLPDVDCNEYLATVHSPVFFSFAMNKKIPETFTLE